MDKMFRSKLIDTLIDIRFVLSFKKITSTMISKTEFNNIIEDVKVKSNDVKINEELDKVFEEYLPSKSENQSDKNNVLSLNNMESIVNKIDDITGDGASKGRQYVKASKPFASQNSSDNNEAA